MGTRGVWGERLPLGEVPGARVTVLAVAEDAGGEVQAVRYRVRLGCCGRELVITHAAILRRKTDVRRNALEGRELRCLRCTPVGRYRTTLTAAERERRREARQALRPAPIGPDYGVTPPAWPRPPSIAPGYWRWGQAR